mmetsp:Transcript_25065/g.34930  ORF Transcript_25065/g.34930 Transcript_25065/m.34930 type:complete len:279 (-) Transcript_25065:92-928(-)|eukprot:CAMPEP_0184490156 /NCGR_PEP_ID=MMETSP0113_2-20130426/17207_1 /TAXON_ID=91329 /ORGANISM="Norrisiella sphaerica, Strain BC52" /LENGTH=278 /DNA_ID=CAMNT_0026873915 /DNA_START=108 /DNA_END=944 /DNA_ORIENTATION=+
MSLHQVGKDRYESEPDDKGVKTVTEYKRDESGKIVKKVVTTVQIGKEKQTVNKGVEDRKKWKKFGKAVTDDDGDEAMYTIHGEVFNLEMKRRETNHYTESDAEPVKKQVGEKKSVFKCTNCGEVGHYSLKCPKRKIGAGPSAQPVGMSGRPSAGGGVEPGKYVPIHLRGGSKRSSFQNKDRDFSLRVSNIYEEATEQDLRDLFRSCGETSSVYLARDKKTGKSRGFAYVRYTREEDAERAIEMLDGYGYANLILSVEKAKPRENRTTKEGDDKYKRKY